MKGSGPHVCGPCLTCGDEFKALTQSRKYCTRQCWQKRPRRGSTAGQCCVCGGDTGARSRKYCGIECRREERAAKFAAVAANPPAVETPDDYVAYLDSNTLPCLVVGCEWEGEWLGRHVDRVHSLSVAQFKELAGFNRGTSLLGKAAKAKRVALAHKLIAAGHLVPGHVENLAGSQTGGTCRSQGRKRHSQAMKATLAGGAVVVLTCHGCGCEYESNEFAQRRSKYCTTACRHAAYARERAKQ
jgi:hypothetical protein